MNSDTELNTKIQEMQVLEHNLQNILMQSQNIQIELNEVSNALEELSKSDDEVYRILGGIMIKADKKSVSEDLEEKKKILDLRIKSVEKQQKLMEQKLESMRSELQELIKKGN